MPTPGLAHTAAVLSVSAAALICQAPPDGRLPGSAVVVREVYLMGTRATLVTLDEDRARGLRRLGSLIDTLEQAEAELSTWRSDSAVSRLNRQPSGAPLALPAATCAALTEVMYWHRLTSGAFDPTVGALMSAWDLAGAGRIPDPRTLDAARRRTGLHRLRLDRDGCRIERAGGVQLDTGGFGKGEALDRAAAAADGAAPWMINLGGQISIGGPAPPGPGWDVAVAHPRRRDAVSMTLALRTGSLATSGGSEQDLIAGGRRVGHILDPRTGRPAAFTGSVAVWHERALAADILSTALYVMGPETGLRWAHGHGIAACFLQADTAGDGVETVCSRPFERRFGPPARSTS